MAATAAAERLAVLIGTGLVSVPEPVFYLTDEPKIPGYVCAPSDAARARYASTDAVHGQGFHPDDALAKLKAAAECLERLALYNPDADGWHIGPYAAGAGRCDPALFRAVSAGQVGDVDAFDDALRRGTYRWWPAREWVRGAEAAIPAQAVFISGAFDDEAAIRGEQITTGAALGPAGTGEAFERGLLEVVERDACVSAYLKKAAVPRITGLPEDLARLVAYLERYQLEAHLFDVTTDLGIPVVLAITLDRTGLGAAVTTGSSAAWSHEHAIRRALLESIQCRRTSRLMRDQACPDGLPSEADVTSLDRRFYYWHGLDRIADLAFWLDSPEAVDFGTLARQGSDDGRARRRLEELGYHVFVADATPLAIRDAGVEVVKVVIPELHPLYLDERAKCLYSVHHGEIADDPALRPHPLT